MFVIVLSSSDESGHNTPTVVPNHLTCDALTGQSHDCQFNIIFLTLHKIVLLCIYYYVSCFKLIYCILLYRTLLFVFCYIVHCYLYFIILYIVICILLYCTFLFIFCYIVHYLYFVILYIVF